MMRRTLERHVFLSDILVGLVEGRPNSWFSMMKDYDCDKPSVRLAPENPFTGDDYLPWRTITVETIARGLAKLADTSLNSNDKARILGANVINDAGLLDINDYDVILQAAIYGEVHYS